MADWRQELLRQLGAPLTAENVRFLTAWQQAEGTTAGFNPLATTQPAAGATRFNRVGVRNYPSQEAGVRATVQTLLNGRYNRIVGLLRSGTASAEQLARAVAASPWGTGSLVLKVLGAPAPAGETEGSGGAPAPVSPAAPAADPLAGFALDQLARIATGRGSRPTDALAALAALPRPTDTIPAAAAAQPVSAGSLDELLRESGLADAVTSGDRSPARNRDVGGAPASWHLQPGRARDLDPNDPDFPRLVALARAQPDLFEEFFFDPLGWYVKRGRIVQGSIGGHDDHGHVVLRTR